MKQFHVGILLFNEVDAMDFVGPYEVFNLSTYKDSDVQKLFLNQLGLEEKPFIVNTVSEDGKPITVHNGLRVHPDYCFQTAPDFDIIVVPGGPYRAIKTVSQNKQIMNWISHQSKEKLILSVCTGAFFLAQAGLLQGKQATTNQTALDLLEKSYPKVEVVRGVKFVDQGNVVTAAGISAGIDMSLHIVGRLLNEEAGIRTAQTIEYNKHL
ncbi:AraC family transcriptional regulator [Siminovitchia terrae]|uniref:AraC family transcriptional regulator n=1 Tax=Siminovitchia terrae TaxID=1914933 RepID=A0ABQ4L3C3_SIMTE|nr:DJ-1/PfpI family protein [Siminovitchia terrae]GIN93900.1 AraC family transcriptional regulator [Siminovitchia terrae]GIN98385.1 AraC family transcriptional regulator [Siminovitchia terrae]